MNIPHRIRGSQRLVMQGTASDLSKQIVAQVLIPASNHVRMHGHAQDARLFYAELLAGLIGSMVAEFGAEQAAKVAFDTMAKLAVQPTLGTARPMRETAAA